MTDVSSKRIAGVRTSDKFKVEDLLIPRMIDDKVADPDSLYLHYRALLMLFWDIFPSGAIETNPVADDGYSLTMSCTVWETRTDERPMVTVSYKMMYDDDVCDTYMACQSMAIRNALIACGIGTEIELEEERKRRIEKILGPATPADMDSEAAIFNEVANVLGKKDSDEKPKKALPKDPFKEEGVELTDDQPKTEAPKKKRGRPKKVPENIDGYVVAEGDILHERYANQYTGRELSAISVATMRIMLEDENNTSKTFAQILQKYIDQNAEQPAESEPVSN